MPDASKAPTRGSEGDKPVQSNGYAISDEEMKVRLSDELEELLASSTDHDLDVDKLDGILAALDELDPLPDTEALDPQAGLRRLHERLMEEQDGEAGAAAAQNRTSSSQSRAQKHSVWKLILIAAVLVSLFILPVQGNQNLFHLFTEQLPNVFHIGVAEPRYAQITRRPLEIDETRYYDSVPEMMDAFGVTVPLFPAWVPERFGEPEITATVNSLGTKFYISFSSTDGYLLMQGSEIDSNYAAHIESDQLDERKVVIKGIDFFLVSDTMAEKASWQNGVLDCVIQGTVSEEEMQEMILSIYGGK